MKLKSTRMGLIFSLLCFSGVLYAERVTIPEGTRVQVRLRSDLLSNQVHEGTAVYLEVVRPVIVRGMVAIPVGSDAWGAVQSVKEDKFIKFDLQALRLPDLTIIKLRSIREKSKKSGKDQLKVESELGDTVGAPKGTEFTGYVDDDVSVEAAAAAPTTPSPAAVTRPAAPSPAPAIQSPAPSHSPAEVAPTTPARVAVAPAPQTAPQAPAATLEPVTLECFSDPTGADITIDGDFRGTTPSILKIPGGKHHLEYGLSGYNLYARDLDLKPGMGIQTIRVSLQKKE